MGRGSSSTPTLINCTITVAVYYLRDYVQLAKGRLFMFEDMDHDPVFLPVAILPHHEDHPLKKHIHHETHTERHRNTDDYVAEHYSPVTNRC